MNFYDELDINLQNNMGLIKGNPTFFSMFFSNLYNKNDNSILIVSNSISNAQKIYSSLSNFCDVNLFLMDDFLTSEAVAISPDLKISRLETIKNIISNDKNIVVCNLMGYLRFLPSVNKYKNSIINLKVNDDISPDDLVNKLVGLGYEVDSIVNKTGDVGIRGFVVDIFPLFYNHPVRLEFFGDTIDSIRIFDEDSQRSIQDIKELEIYPLTEFITDKNIEIEKNKQKFYPQIEKVNNISDYLKKLSTIYVDIDDIKQEYNKINKDIDNYRDSKDKTFKDNYMFELDEIINKENYKLYYYSINKKITNYYSFDCINVIKFNEDIDAINKYISELINNGRIISICLKKYQLDRIKDKIKSTCIYSKLDDLKSGVVNLIDLDIGIGFEYKNFVFIGSEELFNIKLSNKKYFTKFKYSSPILDINKINVGDYVVHNTYGIGVYNGVVSLTNNNEIKDYLEVLYGDNDKIYIPVNSINLISKYSGRDGVVPKINSLNSNEWHKTKKRISEKVQIVADKLLKLYAERASRIGYSFSSNKEKIEEFESLFEYEYTSDQIKSINEIQKDMESNLPMDRLLCGDVGFGKTEVAFVAAYKAILDNKQVMLLCPTTILSKQHYENALNRFSSFGVEVALLNRFVNKSRQDEILVDFACGKINMLIGTHRLLSSDIEPLDLGLIIIDEEQRFGVRHKERLKELKTQVDVLTLSATPIPRTLQMSLVGIRSLSLIETPPINRLPVETYVLEEDPNIIKDACEKEMSRGGQVYILYNRVETIELVRDKLANLVNARIGVAHGQMDKNRLENTINDFINYEYDILLCTTIIEIGMDISRVNTLIVLDADKFGLSQLYQLRGRVGRSDLFAFCYLMYKSDKILTSTAKARLDAISNFTQLGSGFAIASRDLSIRGAGDILGLEQAGFIDSVGVDLYLKMLNDEVNKRKTNKSEEEVEIPKEVKYNKPLVNVSNHIDDNYVKEEDLKLEIHKLITRIDSKLKLEEVKLEIKDRFGEIPDSLLIYMHEEWFEKIARSMGINESRQSKNTIEITLSNKLQDTIDIAYLFNLAKDISNNFSFKNLNNQVVVILYINNLDKHPIYYLCELFDKLLEKYKDFIE